MGNHAGRVPKHPYMLAKFWTNPNNWFWVGKNYTPASIKMFEETVERARIEEDRWSKGGEIDRLIARK